MSPLLRLWPSQIEELRAAEASAQAAAADASAFKELYHQLVCLTSVWVFLPPFLGDCPYFVFLQRTSLWNRRWIHRSCRQPTPPEFVICLLVLRCSVRWRKSRKQSELKGIWRRKPNASDYSTVSRWLPHPLFSAYPLTPFKTPSKYFPGVKDPERLIVSLTPFPKDWQSARILASVWEGKGGGTRLAITRQRGWGLWLPSPTVA